MRIRLAFLLAGGLLLGLLVARADVSAIGRAMGQADGRWLGLAVLLLAANVAVKTARWQVMVARLTGIRLSARHAMPAILAGVAAASLSPARAVDLAKPLMLKRLRGVGLSSSTSAVLVERFLDGAALVVLLGGALVMLPIARTSQFGPVLSASGLLLIAGALLLASPAAVRALSTGVVERLPLRAGLRERIHRFSNAFADGLMVWRAHRTLWPLLGLSVIAAVLEAGRLAAVFAAVGLVMPVPGAMLAFSAANLVAVLTLIPGGIGITELSMAGLAGVILGARPTAPEVAAAVLVDRALSYYLVVALGALVLLAWGGIRERVA